MLGSELMVGTMSNWFMAWMLLAGLIGLVWLIRLGMLPVLLGKREILGSDSYNRPPAPAPRISVLVAARDEEESIEACIATLLGQDYPNFEVIAIDDRSTDRTPQHLRRLEGEADGRLRVVTVRELRKGWFGKNNAMRSGVEASSGDWLCFADADCRQVSARTLTVAMSEALARNVDFLSITPVLETKHWWERLIQPVCTLILIVWFLPWRVNDPQKETAYANGAFMLIRRECYDAIGGHERVRTELNEDMQLARLAKRMGRRLRVVENDDLYRTKMYRTPAEAWRGWSRIFYGCLGTLPRLGTSALLVTLLAVTPWISLVGAFGGWGFTDRQDASLWLSAAGAWFGVILLKQAVVGQLYPVLRVGRLWSLTYIIGALVALGMLINAMLKAAGANSTTWRGRTYRGHRLETESGSSR